MNKKIMLLALAAVSAAMVALPAAASATPAHISQIDTFTVTGGAGQLTRTDGTHVSCSGVGGSGSFETTTTGKVSLTFTGCKNNLGFNCTTSPDTAGTITANNLPFHLITLPEAGGMPKKGGVLITPDPNQPEVTPGKRRFAQFACFGVTVTVFGNGIIGTLDPGCGASATSWELTFESSSTGHQTDQSWTGVTYALESSIGEGSHETSSIDNITSKINFAASRTLSCT